MLAILTSVGDIFVMLLRVGIDRRPDKSGLQALIEPNARCKNAAAILFTAHRLDGPVPGRAGRNAGPRQSRAVTGDSTMTESENGLNRRKVLDMRNGRLVEAHMALICGRVITWFVGCRL